MAAGIGEHHLESGLMSAARRSDLMFKNTRAFSSFSVNDIQRARDFYGRTLGLEVSEQKEGLALQLAGGGRVFLYPKPNHVPATFTVLNFAVPNVEEAVGRLKSQGVCFERYDQPG